MPLKKQKVRLGVNIDHVATLRSVRGNTTAYPSIWEAAQEVVKGGADQITIHLREDRRHIQDADVVLLCKKRPCLINLEVAATKEMQEIALKNRPDWVCLVPEKRKELTTEGGLNVVAMEKKLKKMTKLFHEAGIKVSLFIAGDLKQVEASHRVGADAVELHTGHWVLYKGKQKTEEFKSLKEAAKLCKSLGMNVHAGHGLDLKTTKQILKLPHLEELNIGHSIVCNSLFIGLKKATREFKSVLKS
jgi:pyridoxine 5-phosphate synthase